jgi:hypothetical protein
MSRAYGRYGGEEKNAYKVLVSRANGNRPLGSPSGRCDDIKRNMKERE